MHVGLAQLDVGAERRHVQVDEIRDLEQLGRGPPEAPDRREEVGLGEPVERARYRDLRRREAGDEEVRGREAEDVLQVPRELEGDERPHAVP